MRRLASKEKKGILYSFSIVLISLGIFWFLTSGKESLYVLKNISIKYLILLFVIVILFNLFNMIRLNFLVKSAGYKMSYKNLFHYTITGVFAGFITPMQSGGIPLQLYLSKKENIPLSSATSILMMRGIMAGFVFVLSLPVVAPVAMKYINNGKMSYLLKYFVSLYAIVGIIMLILFVFSHKIEKVLEKRMRGGRIKEYLLSFVKGVENFIDTTIYFFTKGKWNFMLSLLFTALMLVLQSAISPVLLLSMGIKDNLMLSFIFQFLLIFLLSFTPTPGGSGIAEGSGWLLFRYVCPKEYISVYVVMWRFFSTIINVILGFIGFLIFIEEENKEIEISE